MEKALTSHHKGRLLRRRRTPVWIDKRKQGGVYEDPIPEQAFLHRPKHGGEAFGAGSRRPSKPTCLPSREVLPSCLIIAGVLAFYALVAACVAQFSRD